MQRTTCQNTRKYISNEGTSHNKIRKCKVKLSLNTLKYFSSKTCNIISCRSYYYDIHLNQYIIGSAFEGYYVYARLGSHKQSQLRHQQFPKVFERSQCVSSLPKLAGMSIADNLKQ